MAQHQRKDDGEGRGAAPPGPDPWAARPAVAGDSNPAQSIASPVNLDSIPPSSTVGPIPPSDSFLGSPGDSVAPPTPPVAAPAAPVLTTTGRSAPIRKTTVLLPGHSARYHVKKEFARGGMGRILLAFDSSIGREVALKELLTDGLAAAKDTVADAPPDPAATHAATMPGKHHNTSGAHAKAPPPHDESLERFLREARITGCLEHPSIVPVHEIGQRPDGSWYYTMKLVRGATMAAKIAEIEADKTMNARGKLAERLKLLGPFARICNAVAYAHSREVVHRDLKPENIMLGDFGETVLLDWGLARMEGMDEGSVTPAGPEELRKRAERRLRAQGVNTSRLTLDGSVMGTPAYMPPEQASGKLTEIDERSDVYSLGAILYEIITGKQPYTGDSALEVIDAVLAGPPTKIGALCPEAPPELVSVCEQAMARERDNRIASSKELGDEITAWRDGRALRSYRYSAWEHVRRVMRGHWDAAGVAAIALVALLGFGLWSYNRIHAENDDLQNAKAAAEREHNEALEREKRLQDTIDRLTREHAEKAGTPQPGAGK